MIEEESLEYMKLTVNESLLENHFPDLSSDSRFRRDLLKDRVKALDACCEVNSEMYDVVIQHKSKLAIAYPGLVALPEEIASALPPETAKKAGVGLAEEEVKKNVVKFHIWFIFNELRKDPKCEIRLENTRNVILKAKGYDVEVNYDYLVYFISVLKPFIDEENAVKKRAHSEIQSLKIINSLTTLAKATRMWHKSLDKRSRSGDDLSCFENQIREKDIETVVSSMATYIMREADKKR